MPQPHSPECRPDPTLPADNASSPPRTSPGRDAQGRFVKGNAGGPGNPFARQVAALRTALVRRISEEDVEQIAEDLVVQAKAGNLAATKLLFLYVLGKPAEAVDPDAVDVHEWQQLYRPLAQIAQELPPVRASLPAATACAMAEAAQPFVAAARAEALRLPQEEVERTAEGAPAEGDEVQQAAARPKAAYEVPASPSPNGGEGGLGPPPARQGRQKATRAASGGDDIGRGAGVVARGGTGAARAGGGAGDVGTSPPSANGHTGPPGAAGFPAWLAEALAHLRRPGPGEGIGKG